MVHDVTLLAATRHRRPLRWRALRIGVLASLSLLLPLLVLGQSCALCYTQAASSGSRMIRALRSGILILVLPPTLMSIGVIFVAYAKRNQFRRTDSPDSEQFPDPDDSLDRQKAHRPLFFTSGAELPHP
jgi:hypothetical protein